MFTYISCALRVHRHFGVARGSFGWGSCADILDMMIFRLPQSWPPQCAATSPRPLLDSLSLNTPRQAFSSSISKALGE